MKISKRQAMREAQKKRQVRSQIFTYTGLGLVLIAVIAVIAIFANKAPVSSGPIGEVVAIPSRDHVPNNAVPGPYNSNPPAGGAHFATDWSSKFYQETDLPALPPHPEGYLVHSLEHGYVIFWYNCQIPNTDCPALKQTIQNVWDETGGTKLIAFPWTTMDTPLAMTSWGRIMRFPTPDPALMKQFVKSNRGQAPEPDAP
jgi:hypothetical protein